MEKLINKIRQSNIKISVVNDQLKLSIPPGADASEILAEVRAHKEALIAYIQKARSGATAAALPRSAESGGDYDVFHQQKKEYLRYLVLGPQAFNMGFNLKFENVDRLAMEKAIRAIFERHQSLRTTYSCTGGVLQQHVHAMNAIGDRIQYFDLSEKDNKEALAQELFYAAVNRKFDFEKDLLADVRLVRVDATTSYLLVTVHHVCCDDISRGILETEIQLLYDAFHEGKDDPLPPAGPQYKDYAAWSNSFLQGEKGAAAREFYRNTIGASLGEGPHASYREILREELQRASINADAQPFQQAFGSLVNLYPQKGARYRICIKESAFNKLKQLALACGSSLNMALTAAFAAWLHKVTGKDSIRLYLPFSTRDAHEFEGIVGWLTSEIILTVHLKPGMTARQLIEEVTSGLLETSPHRYYPHEAILNDLDVALHELVHALLNFERAPVRRLQHFAPVHDENGSGHFNMRCVVADYDNGLELLVNYNLSIYTKEQITAIVQLFIDLLDNNFSHPDAPIIKTPPHAACDRLQPAAGYYQ